MHDLLVAANAVDDDAATHGSNGPAFAWMLDVPENEAREILREMVVQALVTQAGSEVAYGPDRNDPRYLAAITLRLGVALGIAAERMRQS